MDSAVLITYDQDDMINEAVALCESADYKVKHVIKQNFLQKPKYGLSGGKIEDLKEIISTVKPDVIVFDEILKPSQNYNLASELKMEILDREALILQIFEKRSSSAESKLQVKLAQARYDMSRAKEKVRLSKKGEQPGFMGLGTFEVDVYYNEIKKRMINIKSKLVKSGKQRKLHRQARKRLGFKTISLAGYTSAGKTTLFNALTGEQREKNDELFTTLSTTVRRVMINQEIALISDTVGFISKLPAYMIEAFKSTLEELLYTDVIIFVIDASDNLDELQKKFKSCYTTLNEIGVESNKLVFALNKSELLDGDQVLDIVDYLELKGNKKWVDISAVTGKNMDEMKFDMCGAAAVLGAMKVIGQVNPKLNIIAVIPTTENMPGGDAQRPGDIVTAHNGKRVEILNTDAEGRLILGDALSYVVKEYKPDAVIDLATLTGACVAALGHLTTGAVSNNDALMEQVRRAGDISGDRVWQFPSFPEYGESIKGKYADLQNIGGGDSGVIVGGLFLEHFVDKTPWVHLDIAGTSWNVKHLGYQPNSGATGVGVRLLVDFVQEWQPLK